ncbi:cupin domain-containing protein [Streptomyces sp. NPDC003077]|uniref:cupin domain-containing protein n=1 Tax=Streptomyces sp. NPDC003077 TaxID=3154443 RepID=UPI0033AE5CB8
MTALDLGAFTDALPQAWSSRIVGEVAGAWVKVLRMDEMPVVEESHTADEILVVVDGVLELTLGDEPVSVPAGSLCRVPAGVPHAVRSGSRGTLLIVEAAEGSPSGP